MTIIIIVQCFQPVEDVCYKLKYDNFGHSCMRIELAKHKMAASSSDAEM